MMEECAAVMRAFLLFLLVSAALFSGPWIGPSTAAEDGPDITITLSEDGAPRQEGQAGWFTLDEQERGVHYAWTMDLPDGYVVVDVRIPHGLFDVDRPQQIVPMVNVSASHYPLFNKFPRDDLWNADAPAQVYRYIEDGDATVLRLGFPGPLNGTFTLSRDTEPPVFEIGPVEDLVHRGFYQETTTDELAKADLRVRPVEGGLERENPTATFAYLQKFPVHGLDPETEYEVWIIFEDWAGNTARSDTYTVTTPPRPMAPPATITPLAPQPNATHVAPDVTIEVAIEAETRASVEDVRLFIDARQVDPTWDRAEGLLTYAPAAPLEEGRHRVSVEVTDAHGNVQHRQWAFWVGPGPADTEAPAPPLLFLAVALLALVAFARARRAPRDRC